MLFYTISQFFFYDIENNYDALASYLKIIIFGGGEAWRERWWRLDSKTVENGGFFGGFWGDFWGTGGAWGGVGGGSFSGIFILCNAVK